MQRSTHTPGFPARRAFTLIELLVVISIIGVMTSLIVAGAMKFKDVSRTNAADAQVTKYQRALETEYQLVVQQCHRDGPPAAVVSYCGNDVDRARAVHIAATVKINFPETFAEAETAASFNIGGQPYNVKNTFASVRGIASATPASATSVPTADEQRAILLYLIIKEKATAGTGADTDGTGEQRTATFGTKSLTHFIDAYGIPLVYYRWSPGLPSVTFDPLDPPTPSAPTGRVASWSGAATLNAAPYNLRFNGTNRAPSVVSAGKNKTFESFGGDDRVGFKLTQFGAKGDGK